MDATLHETLTAWRRHLHAHPELTLHERNTAAFVQARLAELGVLFMAGIGGHGVVATLSRGQSNRSRRSAGGHGRPADPGDQWRAIRVRHTRRNARLRP